MSMVYRYSCVRLETIVGSRDRSGVHTRADEVVREGQQVCRKEGREEIGGVKWSEGC
jgi:hypothetical protein